MDIFTFLSSNLPLLRPWTISGTHTIACDDGFYEWISVSSERRSFINFSQRSMRSLLLLLVSKSTYIYFFSSSYKTLILFIYIWNACLVRIYPSTAPPDGGCLIINLSVVFSSVIEKTINWLFTNWNSWCSHNILMHTNNNSEYYMEINISSDSGMMLRLVWP